MADCAHSNHSLPSVDKWRYTLYTTVLFLLFANPFTFRFVHSLLGRFIRIVHSNGCPTIAGLFLHAFIFTLILRYMMEGEGEPPGLSLIHI